MGSKSLTCLQLAFPIIMKFIMFPFFFFIMLIIARIEGKRFHPSKRDIIFPQTADKLKKEGEDCGSCYCPPTFSAGKCGPGLSCVRNENIPDLPGTCQQVAEGCICPAIFSPVCGTDGKTYSNSCEASCQNAKVACEEDCPCRQEPLCICPAVVEPVCGVNGKTYNNKCESNCDKTPIKCTGKCPCERPDPGFGQFLCGDKDSGVICSYPETCVKIKAPYGTTCTYLKPTCMCGDQECNLTCSDSEICVQSNFLCVKPPCCGANRCEPIRSYK